MPKISVIIPVFNTEKYLQRCLESVLNQTLSDIEIICINDCSADNSLGILREYSAKDKRVKIINFTRNQGAAAARNAGIKEAGGEYLGFIDSDDYIEPDFYENLYKKAVKTGADIIKGSDMKLCYPDGKTEIDEQNYKIRQNKLNFWCQYTTAIFKTDFIKKNKIDFPEGLLVGEDPVCTIKAAILANKIEVINNAQYYYMRREGSLNSDIWDEEKIHSYVKYIEMIADFSLKQNLSRENHAIIFGRLLDSIYQTQKGKDRNRRKLRKIFDDLFDKIQAVSVKYPIKVLFDASVICIANHDLGGRRGIYMVIWNLLKKFVSDSRFDITLWLQRNYGTEFFKLDPLTANLKYVIAEFKLGDGRIIPNKNFHPEEYDVYFNPAPNRQPMKGKRPAVFNILYDVIPILKYDWFEPDFKTSFWSAYASLPSHINYFCDSECCKNDFLRFFDQFDAKRMTVTPISSSQNFYPQKDKNKLEKVLQKYSVKPNSKYIFYIGAVNDPRKNLIFNIECFIQFIDRYKIDDLYFYFGGSGKKEFDEILKTQLGKQYETHKDKLVSLGYIDDEDVNLLYSNSLFFSFLSLYEGFGMPPLEAMMCGVPVICANNSSLPEVVGDAALMVDPEDEDEVIEAFRKFYFDENLRDEYIKKGLKRAELFNWDKTYKIMSEKIIETIGAPINESCRV